MVVSGCTDRGVGAAVEDRRDGTGKYSCNFLKGHGSCIGDEVMGIGN